MVERHLDLLGMKVEDKVTGFSGVVTSVSFDLYGCIQAIINPGSDKDGKIMESHWFDVSRLVVKGDYPVMRRPNFQVGPVAEGDQGAAEKPGYMKS